MKKRILIILASVFFHANVHAYEGSPQEQVSAFFEDFEKGDTDKAIDALYSSNPLMKQKIQDLMALKQQMAMVAGLYGPFIGLEPVHDEQVSPSVVRIVQIAKHEHHPVIWEFHFYKPRDKWMISQAVFADQFQNLDARQ